MPRPIPPRLLTIAGSDSGGGAGIQADLKTFAAHDTYGMSAITALTAQNTCGVAAVHEAPPEMVVDQIDMVFEDIGVDAVKIGMLASAPLIRVVADRMAAWAGKAGDPRRLPIVLDPVMVSKSGAALLKDDAVEALLEHLVPLCTLVTPNAPELTRMTGVAIGSQETQLQAAAELARRGPAVLAKGGHIPGTDVADLLLEGERASWFRHSRITTMSSHGTGCTLSSAIAARLAWGDDLATAVEGGIDYLHGALEAAYPIGKGHGPVDHFYRLDLRRSRE